MIILARERYGFVPWVVGFLVLTWASTLYFGRLEEKDDPRTSAAEGAPGESPDSPKPPELRHEVTSYVTRAMYQETLFFLLPFYAYSTVVDSLNVLFLLLLTGLAVFACFELVFDRWLRGKPVFALIFFATVAFAAINLLLPLVFRIDPRFATPLAIILAIASALPLALRGPTKKPATRYRLVFVIAAILAVSLAVPRLVPPVPLRMDNATFATTIDPQTLEIERPLPSAISPAALNGSLVVLVEVYAPSALPTEVSLEWLRNGETLRFSREIEIVANGSGFRVWDRLRSISNGMAPGLYEVVLRTSDGRVFGVASQEVTES